MSSTSIENGAAGKFSVENDDSDTSLIMLSYNDIVQYSRGENTDERIKKKCQKAISEAFGLSSSCLGILCITDMPELFCSLRSQLLPLAPILAAEMKSSPVEKNDLVVPEASYTVGWSHGVEKVGDDFDIGKGSFYANPLYDDYAAIDGVREELVAVETDRNNTKLSKDLVFENLLKDNPAFFAKNVWPIDVVGSDLKNLEPTFKQMGILARNVCIKVAEAIDGYVSTISPNYDGKVGKVLSQSRYCKGRLLHYFSMNDVRNMKNSRANTDMEKATNDEFADWCGWHNDHGSLTALIPAIYLDPSGQVVDCPDPKSGLYVMSKDGALEHITLPPRSMAVQVGETTQIHTGGLVQATPHCVRGCQNQESMHITRETFAVFFEPEFRGDMEIHAGGRSLDETQTQEAEKFLPPSVKTLRSRWKPGMSFGEFSEATFSAFH